MNEQACMQKPARMIECARAPPFRGGEKRRGALLATHRESCLVARDAAGELSRAPRRFDDADGLEVVREQEL